MEAERLNAREIIPPELKLFDRLKRVDLEWQCLGTKTSTGLSWSEVADIMLKPREGLKPQALCIVNSKRAARELYSEIAAVEPKIVFHLSTSMCPAHRSYVLERVRKRLKEGKACLLVSTQLIEAGVDVDFPMVLRELAPLEAIIQSAGRCNREGALRNEYGLVAGKVIVFRSKASQEHPARYYPPDTWYKAGRSVLLNSFLNAGIEPRIDSPQDINDYFTRLFHTGDLDQHRIQESRLAFRFADVAEHYRLISEDTIGAVVATWEEMKEEIERRIALLRRDPSRRNFRELAIYQVTLRTHEAIVRSRERTRIETRMGQVCSPVASHRSLARANAD